MIRRPTLPLLAALALAACDENTPPPPPDGSVPDTGPEPDAGTPVVTPVTVPVRFIVHHTDYSSSAFSLLDAAGGVLVDGYIHSSTVGPGLSAALSGDTDVPSRGEPGVFTVIDRYGTDVVTRVDLASGRVLGQVVTQGPRDTSCPFSGNPQDVAVVGPNSAWVSRYTHNLVPGCPDSLKGSDLVEFDPATMTLTGARVDLAVLQRDVVVGANTLPARVRPTRIAPVGGTLVVGLDLITDGWEAAADGRVALVKLADRSVGSFDLAPLTNCGRISRVPGRPTYVAVTCSGYLDKTAESGIVVLDVDGAAGTATEVRRYASSAYPSELTVFDSVVVLDDDEILGVHIAGYSPADPPDVLVHLNLATGVRDTLHTAAFASALFTTMAFDADSSLVMVPESGVGIRTFTRQTDGTFVAGRIVAPSGRGLPIDAVHVYP